MVSCPTRNVLVPIREGVGVDSFFPMLGMGKREVEQEEERDRVGVG